MGKANAIGLAGALLTICCVCSVLPACGEVTANGAEETQSCAKKSCKGDDCPPSGGGGHAMAGAGGDCSTAKGGSGGTTGAGGAGGAAVATDVVDFPCTVCRKAENCCRAEGLTDCGYTAACATAKNAEQMEFYLVLCRAVLDASAGSKAPSDVCGM